MPLGLPELAFRAGGFFCIGAFRWAIRLALLRGFANARGAVCCKAIRSAEFLDVEGLLAARSFAVWES